MPDLTPKAIDVNAANHQLGNEVWTTPLATFVRNTDTPSIYDANHVADVKARTPSEIEELFSAVETEYAHSKHRRFDIDYRTPPEFVARLALDGGYAKDDALVMLLEGELTGTPPPPCDIRPLQSEADWETYWQLMLQDWNEHQARLGRKTDESVARQMWTDKQRRQPPVQNWLAYEGDRAVAFMHSWEGTDGVGQVEDLFTHPDFRERGIATALLHYCVAQSRAKGAGPVVIVADPTDTPKNIYSHMGWRPVALVSHYVKQVG